jgi:hypothetical protein
MPPGKPEAPTAPEPITLHLSRRAWISRTGLSVFQVDPSWRRNGSAAFGARKDASSRDERRATSGGRRATSDGRRATGDKKGAIITVPFNVTSPLGSRSRSVRFGRLGAVADSKRRELTIGVVREDQKDEIGVNDAPFADGRKQRIWLAERFAPTKRDGMRCAATGLARAAWRDGGGLVFRPMVHCLEAASIRPAMMTWMVSRPDLCQ